MHAPLRASTKHLSSNPLHFTPLQPPPSSPRPPSCPSMAAILVLLLLLLPLPSAQGATWCVCRSDVSDTALQKALDYACGAGADCTPILQNGACFQPNTVRAHCTYAANSFFQRKGQAAGSCDFSGAATITTTDPSYGSCSYPSSGSSGAITTTPTSSTSTGFNNNGGLGGIGSGNGLSTDTQSGMGGGEFLKAGRSLLPMSLILSGLVLMRDFFRLLHCDGTQ